MQERELTDSTTTKTLDRRELLRRGALTSGVGAAAVALGWTGAACGRAAETGSLAPTITPGSSTLTIDVACLGYTYRQIAPEGATFPDSSDPLKEFDARGTTFSVEGDIYPDGTISGDGFDPARHESERVGTWFCRGWYLLHSQRPEPHVLTSQEYVLGIVGPDNLFPGDQIVSSGLEGVNDGEQLRSFRSVIGGTGRYSGTLGQVLQEGNGVNTTVIEGVGNAPNFLFTFDLA